MSGCYGLEKCLSSFDLVDIQPGSKLHELGLRKTTAFVETTGEDLLQEDHQDGEGVDHHQAAGH